MRKARIITSFLIILLLTACTEMKTLEKMGMITTLGYDLTEDKKILTTMVLLQIDPEAPRNTGVLSARAVTSKGARIAADLKSPKKMQSGQLRVALYSEDIAKQGIINLADTLARDPSISDLTYLAIVEGNVENFLKRQNDQFTDIGQYVYKELDQNIKGELIPSSTLQEVMHDYYAVGVDPLLPTMKAEDGQVKITGMALMEMDKMVGKISATQAFYIKLINDRFEAGSVELTLNKDDIKFTEQDGQTSELAVVLDTITSRSDIKLINKDIPEFNMTIKLDSRLLEVNQSLDLKNPANVKKLEKIISKKMKSEVENLLEYTKSKKSDPFGFGEVYRGSVKHTNLTHSKWHDLYDKSKINVIIDFTIIRTGVVE
ncbi:Ger(x)C family spore germination protein [Bacillus sp. JJ1122]|uniref:Ger(x)C family spore germination protein n=1 Tax=Bacillus sp. JJ1122 TaxID=3122951 RepID=UPI002FFF3801